MSYSTHWRAFYRKTYIEKSGKALWDVDPALSASTDYQKFAKWMDHTMPLLDIGCGTGAPTAFLSRYFPSVIGIDTAEEAVRIAKETLLAETIDFRCVDLANRADCLDLHREFGDMNLYMRGVLHQIKPEHKTLVVENLASMMGEKGILYLIEVASEIRTYFREASAEFHLLPKEVQAAFISNLPPEGVTLEDIPLMFPKERFEILEAGKDFLMTNLTLSNGIQITIPAVYCILRRVKLTNYP